MTAYLRSNLPVERARAHSLYAYFKRPKATRSRGASTCSPARSSDCPTLEHLTAAGLLHPNRQVFKLSSEGYPLVVGVTSSWWGPRCREIVAKALDGAGAAEKRRRKELDADVATLREEQSPSKRDRRAA